MAKCEHVWVRYYSTRTQQCNDCKLIIPLNQKAGLTEHKDAQPSASQNYNIN